MQLDLKSLFATCLKLPAVSRAVQQKKPGNNMRQISTLQNDYRFSNMFKRRRSNVNPFYRHSASSKQKEFPLKFIAVLC